MKEELGTWGAAVGSVVLACLFGGLTLAIYPGWVVVASYLPPAPNWSDAIGAVSALGTCAAVAVALWQANRNSREQREQRLVIAQLHAAAMSESLQMAWDNLRLNNALLTFSDSPANVVDGLKRVVEAFRDPWPTPSPEVLASLVPLPNHCAHRVARAYDIIATIRYELRNTKIPSSAQTETHRCYELRGRWMGAMSRAADFLQVAIADCRKAANDGAPFPSAVDLYGEWDDGDFE